MKRCFCILLMLTLLLLSACTPPVEKRIAAYAEQEILITGLKETDFSVTISELSKLPLTTLSATGATQKAGTVCVTGVTMEDFLAYYGVLPEAVQKVRFWCKDGYKVFLKQKTLTEYDILLGIAEQDGPLEEKRQPLRVLIPGEDSGKWAYAVIQIDFVLEE